MFTKMSVSRMFTVLLVVTILFGSAALPTSVGAAGTRFAKPSASGSGDCLSWANACTLQTALTGALAAAGALDPAFDEDGIVVTDIGGNDWIKAMAIQADGRIVVAGATDVWGENDYVLARYNSNGSLDTSFDGDGIVVTDIMDDDYGYAIAIQADGKIVVAGYSVTGGAYDFSLARYNSDGSLDPTFDGDGIVVTDIGGNDWIRAMAIQADGRIVVAGATDVWGENDYALARYNSNGSLDTSFDGDGIVVTDILVHDRGFAIAIQMDGKIVAAGGSKTGSFYDFSLARYNSNGSLDPTFDGDGIVVTDIGGDDVIYTMAIQADGRIVVAGSSTVWGENDYALARYNSNGSLDPSFDGDGIVVTDIMDDDYGYAIAIQANGKIVVAGLSYTGSNWDFSLVRYNSNGSLDAGFDGDGIVVTDIWGDDFGNAIAIQADGKIVVAGYSITGGAYDFSLARYLANNAPTDIALSNSTVAENQPTGTLVGNLTTTDLDPGDAHTYSFACAVPGADDGSFQISGSQLQTNAIFDYETKNSYAICIRTDDGHGGTFDKAFTINVTDMVETLTATFCSTGTQDGWVLETSETSGHGGSISATATTLRIGDNAAKKQYRSILSFATGSSLPDNAVITKVTLKFRKQGIIGGGNPITTFQGFMVDIKKGYFGTTALQTADFQTTGSKTYGPFKPALSSSWYSIDLTSGKDYINKLSTSSGLTQIRLRFKLDDNNNATANYLSLYSGNAGSAYRPQLIIEYYVP
jgi:uncharacterized delta-60 repeat protein